MVHYMHLHTAPFNLIAQKRKTIELRLYDEKRQMINIGDTIIFQNSIDSTKQLHALVKNLYVYESFEVLYASLPLEQCGYMPEEVPNASFKDMERYYPLDMQAKYGVVGIEILLL